jgi:hypothetical protein
MDLNDDLRQSEIMSTIKDIITDPANEKWFSPKDFDLYGELLAGNFERIPSYPNVLGLDDLIRAYKDIVCGGS